MQMNQGKLRKCTAQIFFELASRLLVAFAAFQIQRIMEPTAAISSIIVAENPLPRIPASSNSQRSSSMFRPFIIGRDDFAEAIHQFSLQ